MFFPLEIQQAAAKIIKEIQELAQRSRTRIKHAMRKSEVYIRKENHDGWHFIHLSMLGGKEEIYIPIETRRSRQRTWECSCTSKDTCRHKAAVAFAIQQSCIKEISEMNQEDIHTLFFVKIRDVGLSIYEHFPKKRLLFFIEESLLWGGAIHAYKDWYYSEAYDQELCARIRLDGWQKILSLLTSPSFTTYIKPKERPLCFGDSNPIYNRSTHTIDCSKQTKRALKKLGHSSLIECAMDEDSFSKPSVVSEIEKLGLSTKCHIRLSRWSNGQSISEQLSGCWNEHLFNRVEELELSIRSANCLQNAGIDYIYQLVQKTEGDMLRTKNFGRKSLYEIKAILKERGLTFGMKLHNFPEHIEPEEKWNEHLFSRVEELELSIRSANCLQNAGIDYIYQLVQKTEGDMLRTKNFGRKSLNEIRTLLKERDLTLGMKLHNFPEHKAR